MLTSNSKIFLLIFFLSIFFKVGGKCMAQTNTLTFTIPSGATAENSRIFDDLIHEFNLLHPNKSVKLITRNDWEAVVLEARNKVKNGDDVGLFVTRPAFMEELVDQKIVQPLDKMLQSVENTQEWLDLFYSKTLHSSHSQDGRLFSLPLFRSFPVIYYNLDLLGCVIEDFSEREIPTNWEEFEDLLQRYQDNLKKQTVYPHQQVPLLIGGDWFEWIFESMVMQCGGLLGDHSPSNIYLYSPPALEALNTIARLHEKGLLEIANNWKGGIHGFINKTNPIAFASSGGMANINRKLDDWTVQPLPGHKTPFVPLGGGNLYLSKNLNPEQIETAYALINYLLEPEIQARISFQTGYSAVIKKAIYQEPIRTATKVDDSYALLKEQFAYAKPNLITNDYSLIRQILQRCINNVVTGKLNPQDALIKAQAEADEILGN